MPALAKVTSSSSSRAPKGGASRPTVSTPSSCPGGERSGANSAWMDGTPGARTTHSGMASRRRCSSGASESAARHEAPCPRSSVSPRSPAWVPDSAVTRSTPSSGKWRRKAADRVPSSVTLWRVRVASTSSSEAAVSSERLRSSMTPSAAGPDGPDSAPGEHRALCGVGQRLQRRLAGD
ncbi:hypothetical protein QOL99_16815, partial [Deinococcus sp. MIMF12]